MAVMVSEIVNGGKKIHPYLVEKMIDPVTNAGQSMRPAPKEERLGLEPALLEKIKLALKEVVASPEGTAHRLSALKIPIGGKTGTAQVVSLDRHCIGAECEDHAWFVGFAPIEKPEIVVAVLVEHGGHGSSAAAPLAGEIIKAYMDGKGVENEKTR
ncbi:MAG: penicillin-binding transpeptidase domain-containing protein, partial [Deltaproteobacteria bacterium]|nr:penicillin-binding transpeptidase domain-containing protein [Deltaproteobacteria bacterium]